MLNTVKFSKEQLKAINYSLDSIFRCLDIKSFDDLNSDNVFKFVGACESVFEHLKNNDVYYIK